MTLLDRTAGSLGLGATARTDTSRDWFSRATAVLAGGISSSARGTTTGDKPYPLYITRGAGSHIWDADGNEFVDYLLSYGSLPLGHADPAICRAVAAQLAEGTMFGTCNTQEVELAEQICRMVPCAELVRFANSGSEAVCGAVRAARGFTGRNRILKFEGHYHGWVDVLAVSNRPSAEQSGPVEQPFSHPHSRGIPAGVVADVVICPWNDIDILRSMLDEHKDELAAVIAEPIVANNACIMPVPGYLDALRAECTRRGILLIFDEIVTGFRVARGGAQELFGVIPDIAVYSKALGGGLPISAFAGRRQVMLPVAANTVKHGGTYNGNPLCAASAVNTLRALGSEQALQKIHAHGEVIIDAIRRAAMDNRVPCIVQGLGSMFQIVFGIDGPIRHYRDLHAADSRRYAAFRQSLLEQGMHVNSAPLACWFVSTAHTDDDAEFAVAAVARAMQSVA
jgi:glutamate-1-semialdehyde 2,1-aminomutase